MRRLPRQARSWLPRLLIPLMPKSPGSNNYETAFSRKAPPRGGPRPSPWSRLRSCPRRPRHLNSRPRPHRRRLAVGAGPALREVALADGVEAQRVLDPPRQGRPLAGKVGGGGAAVLCVSVCVCVDGGG